MNTRDSIRNFKKVGENFYYLGLLLTVTDISLRCVFTAFSTMKYSVVTAAYVDALGVIREIEFSDKHLDVLQKENAKIP